MLKKIFIIFTVAVVAVAGAGVAGHDWWERNRMSWDCLLVGFWGDYGWGWGWYANFVDEYKDDGWQESEWLVLRHWDPDVYPDACASADADKHWRVVAELSEERDWKHANFWHSLKLGYGGFYGVKLYDSEIKTAAGEECSLYAGLSYHLGDGESLDLPRSFALLQRSAAQGYYASQVLLAIALKTGEWGKYGKHKVEVDLQTAEELLRKGVAEFETMAATVYESEQRQAEECLRQQFGWDFDFNQQTGANS